MSSSLQCLNNLKWWRILSTLFLENQSCQLRLGHSGKMLTLEGRYSTPTHGSHPFLSHLLHFVLFSTHRFSHVARVAEEVVEVKNLGPGSTPLSCKHWSFTSSSNKILCLQYEFLRPLTCQWAGLTLTQSILSKAFCSRFHPAWGRVGAGGKGKEAHEKAGKDGKGVDTTGAMDTTGAIFGIPGKTDVCNVEENCIVHMQVAPVGCTKACPEGKQAQSRALLL